MGGLGGLQVIQTNGLEVLEVLPLLSTQAEYQHLAIMAGLMADL